MNGGRGKSNATIKVALVDDHRMTHAAVAEILRTVTDIQLVGQGHNGAEALEICRAHAPDIVLMDVVMPVMDGIAATRAPRSLATTCGGF